MSIVTHLIFLDFCCVGGKKEKMCCRLLVIICVIFFKLFTFQLLPEKNSSCDEERYFKLGVLAYLNTYVTVLFHRYRVNMQAEMC